MKPELFIMTGSDLQHRDAWHALAADCWAKEAAHSRPKDNPRHPTGLELSKSAHHLGTTEPKHWLNDERHHIYKCNKFVDAVLRQSGINLRWDAAHIPSVHYMRQQLALDRDFQVVFKSHSVKFDQYRAQAGDIVMWDVIPPHYPNEHPRPFEHSGILNEKGVMMYAGSTRSGGYDETPLKTLVGIYGEPTVIYRYSPPRH